MFNISFFISGMPTYTSYVSYAGVGVLIKDFPPSERRSDLVTVPKCIVLKSNDFIDNIELLTKMQTENFYCIVNTGDFYCISTQW